MKVIKSFYVIFSVLILISCSEDPLHSANGSDGIAPGKVVVNNIENVSGGAVIKFTPPTDADLLYIKGSYSDENGTPKQVIVSSFIDTLSVIGFGQVGEYPVEIRAVDIGDNE